MNVSKSTVTLFASLLLFANNAIATTSVPLINFDPNISEASFEANTDGTPGWSFFVHEPVEVTGVGWHDEDGDGLSHAHLIGLWRDTSGSTNWPYFDAANAEPVIGEPTFVLNPLPVFGHGVVIPAGEEAELSGIWRRQTLADPVVLQPGGYFLGGLDNSNSTDSTRGLLEHFSMGLVDERITMGGSASVSSSGYQPADAFYAVGAAVFGPMLFAEPVPEPSAGLLMISVATAHAIRRRRP